MADVVDKATRSRMMAGIGPANTRPELLVRRYLHARGFRYRIHPRELPGKPDLLLPRYNVALFVHGCFWHRHPGCRFATHPGTRVEFWMKKFEENVARDKRKAAKLRRLGWRVLTIWECQAAKPAKLVALANRIAKGQGSPVKPEK